jgi:hypothetical protein
MLLEGLARPLVLLHALLGATVVATTTHHLIWIIRSRGARRRGEPRFALLASGFFVLVFVFGSLIYPTYRVRVRAEFFDVGPLMSASHVFDMKEHLVALGLLASLSLLWLSRRTDPSDPAERRLYLGLGWFTCATSWSGLLIGLYTASLRAVGAP